jgi:hypothetical protein
MLIIGSDYHPAFQQIAFVGTETGNCKRSDWSTLRQRRSSTVIKPYWTKRFEKVSVPFELRLLNGMNPPAPEVTVLIHKITKDRRAGEYQLHIKKVPGTVEDRPLCCPRFHVEVIVAGIDLHGH